MTAKECIRNYAKHKDWKVVSNGVTLVTNKSCVYTSEKELKEIGKRNVLTTVDGTNEITIVIE